MRVSERMHACMRLTWRVPHPRAVEAVLFSGTFLGECPSSCWAVADELGEKWEGLERSRESASKGLFLLFIFFKFF